VERDETTSGRLLHHTSKSAFIEYPRSPYMTVTKMGYQAMTPLQNPAEHLSRSSEAKSFSVYSQAHGTWYIETEYRRHSRGLREKGSMELLKKEDDR